MIIFIFKNTLLKLKIKNISNIEFKKNMIVKNYILVFLYFFLWDLQKKKAFYYFYITIKIIYCTSNKLSIFKFFNLKFFKSFLDKFLFSILINVITSFPLIVIKNTNFSYNKIKPFINKNFFNKKYISNIFFDIIASYNVINSLIIDKKIKFNDKLEINPFFPDKGKSLKLVLSSVKDKFLPRLTYVDLHNSINVRYGSYGISTNFVYSTFEFNNNYSFNSCFIKKNDLETEYNDSKLEFYLKQNPYFEIINKNFRQQISGYNESLDFFSFLKYYNIEIPKNEEDLKTFLNVDFNEIIRLKIHLVRSNSLNINSAEDIIKDYDHYSNLSRGLSKDFVLCWQKPLAEFNFEQGSSVIVNDENKKLGDYIINNKHTVTSTNILNNIDNIADFFEKNENLFQSLSNKELNTVLNNLDFKKDPVVSFVSKSSLNYENNFQNTQEFSDLINSCSLDKPVDISILVDKIIQNI